MVVRKFFEEDNKRRWQADISRVILVYKLPLKPKALGLAFVLGLKAKISGFGIGLETQVTTVISSHLSLTAVTDDREWRHWWASLSTHVLCCSLSGNEYVYQSLLLAEVGRWGC